MNEINRPPLGGGTRRFPAHPEMTGDYAPLFDQPGKVYFVEKVT